MNKKGKRVEIDPIALEVIQNCVTAGVNEGIIRGIKEINNENNRRIQEKYDRKIRDTRLLLSNYRKFKNHIKETTYTEEQLETATVSEILDKLYISENDDRDSLTIVQSILKSKKRTEIILKHVDTILLGYMQNAYKTHDIELKRRSDVISKLYIEGKKGKSYEEIAEELSISVSTLKRDKNRATTEIAVLMFGIDGIRFD